MAKKVSILVGSLRKGSFARKVAQNVIPMFPEGYDAQIVEIGHLPLYNFDYDDPAETDFPTPESYTAFRETIKASAGVLFVTSENNRTVPACLKNAVDIGSKPNADVAWKNTPLISKVEVSGANRAGVTFTSTAALMREAGYKLSYKDRVANGSIDDKYDTT